MTFTNWVTGPVYGSPLSAKLQCSICQIEQGLSRCTDCHVIFYYSLEHCTALWPQHEATCIEIKNAKLELKLEDEVNPNHENPTLHCSYAFALLKVRTRTAVQSALKQLLECLRVDTGSKSNAQLWIPCLHLRLGEDQKCYNYITWSLEHVAAGYPDWATSDLSQLYTTNANAFEPFDALEQRSGSNNWSIRFLVLLLLKLRLLFELGELKARCELSSTARNKLPAEVWLHVRSYLIGPATMNNRPLMNALAEGKDLSPCISELETEVHMHCLRSAKLSRKFLPALKEYVMSGRHLLDDDSPDFFQTRPALSAIFDAWAETPGAVKWLCERLG